MSLAVGSALAAALYWAGFLTPETQHLPDVAAWPTLTAAGYQVRGTASGPDGTSYFLLHRNPMQALMASAQADARLCHFRNDERLVSSVVCTPAHSSLAEFTSLSLLGVGSTTTLAGSGRAFDSYGQVVDAFSGELRPARSERMSGVSSDRSLPPFSYDKGGNVEVEPHARVGSWTLTAGRSVTATHDRGERSTPFGENVGAYFGDSLFGCGTDALGAAALLATVHVDHSSDPHLARALQETSPPPTSTNESGSGKRYAVRGGYGSHRLSIAVLAGGKWSLPVELDRNRREGVTLTCSEDGANLLFASEQGIERVACTETGCETNVQPLRAGAHAWLVAPLGTQIAVVSEDEPCGLQFRLSPFEDLGTTRNLRVARTCAFDASTAKEPKSRLSMAAHFRAPGEIFLLLQSVGSFGFPLALYALRIDSQGDVTVVNGSAH